MLLLNHYVKTKKLELTDRLVAIRAQNARDGDKIVVLVVIAVIGSALLLLVAKKFSSSISLSEDRNA